MDFHVGEYVQTRDGRTGYIEDVLLWTAIKCVFTHKNGKELDHPETECFINTKAEVLREKFKKIGVCLNHLLEKSSQSNSMMNLSV